MNRSIQDLILILTLIIFSTTAIAQPVEFVIPMRAGWNTISAPVIPEERRIEVMFGEIVRRDNLIIMKDGDGHFYLPDWEWIMDPFWDFRRGYQVKLAGDDTLTITGEPVDPETVIQLVRGWSLIAYFPEEQLNAVTAFANIEDLLIIAKDEFGGFYSPEYDFNNMDVLRPGRGYIVNVREDVELVWMQE